MDQMLVVSLILFSVSQLFQIRSPCNVSSFSTSVFSHVLLVCSTNLIEFILVLQKLQREMEKNSKSQRKKERREIKGQGRKEKDILHNVKSLDDKKCFQQKKGKKGEAKGCCPQKIEHEADQLERSDITNEHGLPTCIENNSYLSDGTQSSKKSKPLIVRIKLLKHSEPDASLACSPSGRVDLLPPERTEVVLAPSQPSAETNVELRQVSSKPDQDLPCSTSEGIETIGQKRSASAAFEDQIQSEDSLHATLIENWIPPPIQFADVGDGDEEWLFGTKHQNRCGSKRFKAADNEVSSCTRSTPWPQAQWLLGAGVYALPFTVPF